MRVALGKFVQAGIETRPGADIGSAVKDGLTHYTSRLDSDEPPLRVPDFCHDADRSEGGDAFEVPVDPETEAALRQEARRQQVPLGQVLSHAILLHLAGLDAQPDLQA